MAAGGCAICVLNVPLVMWQPSWSGSVTLNGQRHHGLWRCARTAQ